MSSASYRKGQQIIKNRRILAKGDTRKRFISAHVAQATEDRSARKTVTAALQKTAKPMRETGALGKVRTRVCAVAAGVRGKTYRYDAAQIARIAAAYNPRNAQCKAARAALLGV